MTVAIPTNFCICLEPREQKDTAVENNNKQEFSIPSVYPIYTYFC